MLQAEEVACSDDGFSDVGGFSDVDDDEEERDKTGGRGRERTEDAALEERGGNLTPCACYWN